MKRRGGKRTWALSLLGLVLFSGFVYLGGLPALKRVASPNWLFLALGLAVQALMYMFTASRWGVISNALAGRRVCSYIDYFFCFMSGLLAGLVVSQNVGAFVVRPLALSGLEGVSVKRSLGSVVLDKLFDLAFVLLFIGPSVLYFFHALSLMWAVAISLVLFGLFSALAFWRYDTIIRWMGKLVLFGVQLAGSMPLLNLSVGQAALEQLAPLNDSTLLGKQVVVKIYLLSVARQVSMILRLYLFALTLGLYIPVGLLFLGIPFAQLSLLVAVTPGALGILELGWYAIFAAAGLDSELVTTFLIGRRAYDTLYITLLLFLSYLAMMLSGRRPILARRDV